MQASSDFCILDFDIPFTMSFVISGTIEVAGTLVIMVMVTWQVVMVAIPALIGVLCIQVSTHHVATLGSCSCAQPM
jgi:uncharacterized membrane protein